MAYYGYPNYSQFYPQTYPQYAPPVQDNLAQLRQNSMTVQNGGDDRIWIQGEVGAKAYIVAPGNTVPLWDSETQTIYLKSVNANGIPSMQILHYTFDDPQPTVRPDQFVTKEEFESRMKEIKEAMRNVSESNANDTGL